MAQIDEDDLKDMLSGNQGLAYMLVARELVELRIQNAQLTSDLNSSIISSRQWAERAEAYLGERDQERDAHRELQAKFKGLQDSIRTIASSFDLAEGLNTNANTSEGTGDQGV